MHLPFYILSLILLYFYSFSPPETTKTAEPMKVKKTDLPVMPPEDILPSLDDEADESDMDDGKLKTKVFFMLFWDLFDFVSRTQKSKQQTR